MIELIKEQARAHDLGSMHAIGHHLGRDGANLWAMSEAPLPNRAHKGAA